MIDHTPPQARARLKKEETKRFFAQVKKKNPRVADDEVHLLHEDVFEETDCLLCANCCKTTSPRFYDADIDRIARHLRIKPSQFVTTYLHFDRDGDYVLNEAPCAFLGADNHCSIYDVRPRACREYPHTDRKKFQQLLTLTLSNAEICPAVYEIVERWKKVV